MARGDLVMFEEFVNYLGQSLYNFETGGDTFKLGLVDSTATPPAHSTATPTWADFSGNEISGDNYTAGGKALTGQTYNEVAGVATFDANDVTWSQASGGVSGFTGAYWAVLYDSTVASPANPGVCYVDMGGPVNNNDGDVTVAWNASGIFTVTV